MIQTVPFVITVRSVTYADHAVCAPDWRWDSRRNRWDGWLLWYAAAGRGRLTWAGVSGGTYAIEAGACFLIDMHDRLLGTADPTDPPEFLALAFTWDGPWPGWRRCRRLRAAPRLEALLEEAITASRAGRRDTARRRLAAALALVAAEDAHPRLAGGVAVQAQAIDDLCDGIRLHPERPWPGEAIARQLACTREHAVRRFRRHCGCSPGAWLTACRMRRARHLLRRDAGSVATIGRAVGFDDPSAFARAFRRHHGISPGDWRRRPWSEDPGNAR